MSDDWQRSINVHAEEIWAIPHFSLKEGKAAKTFERRLGGIGLATAAVLAATVYATASKHRIQFMKGLGEMQRRIFLSVIFSGMALCFASTTWAQTGPDVLGSNPPVFQTLGMVDSTITGVEEADCRGCHTSGVPNRHHMLYGQAKPGGGTYVCLDCHTQGGSGGFVVQRDCVVCHTSSPHHQTQQAIDRQCTHCHGSLVADYNDGHYIPTYAASLVTPKMGNSGEGFDENGDPERISTGLGVVAMGDLPTGPQTRKYPNTLEYEPTGINNDFIISAPRGSTYNYTVEFKPGAALLATWDGASTTDKFLTVELPLAPSTVTANDVKAAINTAIGASWASLGFDGDPTDPATLYPETHYATPGGDPLNNRDLGAGYCSYCHDDDGATDVNGDPAPVLILNNHDTHHGINLPDQVSDGVPGDPMTAGTWRKCNTCHEYTTAPRNGSYSQVGGPLAALHIRVCEECHSPATLHNIQADSDGDGDTLVGGETAGYGHVGAGDSDCWGCHGFDFNASSVPFAGPTIPTVYNTDIAAIRAGKDTMVVLSGASFTNTTGGTSYEADVRLTAANGSSVTLEPELVLDGGSLAVKIPAKTRPGNYRLQATKGEVASNPAVISITPDTRISRATYRGTVTILGTGFGGYANGSPTSVTGTITAGSGRRATTKTVQASILSWSDTKIVVNFGTLPRDVTVNSVFGAAKATVSR